MVPAMVAPFDLTSAFAVVLRELRKEAKLSQEQLALTADLDRTYISLLERGQRQPSIKTLFALAGVLQIPPHQLIARVETCMAEPPFQNLR